MAQLPYICTTAVAQGGPYGSASSMIELGPAPSRSSPRFVANTGTLVEKKFIPKIWRTPLAHGFARRFWFERPAIKGRRMFHIHHFLLFCVLAMRKPGARSLQREPNGGP
jgi:hypothetical protein